MHRQTVIIPTRDQWPDWVKEIVEIKEGLIDQRDQQLAVIAQEPPRQIAPAVDSGPLAPRMTIDMLFERESYIHRMIHEFFTEGIHYGPPFPGSDKKALHKTGAEWLMATFELRPDYIEIEKVIEFNKDRIGVSHIRYEYRCNLHQSSLGGPIVGTGIGVCSSEEEKYKYRKADRLCPTCGAPAIRRSKYGNKGWYCWDKQGGCGEQFDPGNSAITSQETGRVINPDLGGLQHTIAAMAQKRAFVLAIRTATGVSAYFSDVVAYDDPPPTIERAKWTYDEKKKIQLRARFAELGLNESDVNTALDCVDWQETVHDLETVGNLINAYVAEMIDQHAESQEHDPPAEIVG